MRCSGEVHQKPFGQCTSALLSLCWMNFRHHYCGPCGDGFHTTQLHAAKKAQIHTATCCQPSQRKLYCFPINACSFMRASSHRNIAHKEETDRWSSEQRNPHHRRGREGGEMETEGGEERGWMIKYQHVCMFKSVSTAQTSPIPTFG